MEWFGTLTPLSSDDMLMRLLLALCAIMVPVFACYKLSGPNPFTSFFASLAMGRGGNSKLHREKEIDSQCVPTIPTDAALGSRSFVRDLSFLAEHAVMNDVHSDFWNFDAEAEDAAATLQLQLRCRERAPFFAPDKVGRTAELDPAAAAECEVRRRRAIWLVEFKRRYQPTVVEWVDTGVGYEKQACVLLLHPQPETQLPPEPIIAIVFRGSKTYQDYFITDASFWSVALPPVQPPKPAGDRSEIASEVGEVSALVAHADDDVDPREADLADVTTDIDPKARTLIGINKEKTEPCVTLGTWRAYAGDAVRCQQGAGPRAIVRRALTKLLMKFPRSHVVMTGHSLGGALATLCACDTLRASAAARCAGVTLVTFASPRMFNKGFERSMSEFSRRRQLSALRVVVGGDLIPRFWPSRLGGMHGVLPRLLLNPEDARSPLTYSDDDPDDDDLWPIPPSDSHICHALYLSADTTPHLSCTVPHDHPWPVPSNAAQKMEIAAGACVVAAELAKESVPGTQIGAPPPLASATRPMSPRSPSQPARKYYF